MTPDGDDISLPLDLLTRALSRIDDVTELKAVLYVLILTARSGQRSVGLDALTQLGIARSIAGNTSPEPSVERVKRAVERALADGFLLRVTVHAEPDPDIRLLAATEENVVLVDRVADGDDGARDLGLLPGAAISVYRPNVFSLYEQYIGPLTPLIAEQLRDAERLYPREWLEAAMAQAVSYGRRNWRYVEAILTRWEENDRVNSTEGPPYPSA